MADMLTVKMINGLKPDNAKTRKFADGHGHGLMLWIQPSGSRQWVQRIMIHGKRCAIGLGGYRVVGLGEAREKAFENWKVARRGGDPRCQSTGPKVPTFENAARAVHAIHAASWRNDKQRQQWIDEVSRIVWPAIGHLPVDAITTAQLTEIFKPIWLTKPVIANRVRQRTEKILNWAVSQGHRTDNPAGSPLKANLPKQPKGEHHRAIHHREVSGAINAVRESTSGEMVKLAFEFLALTATRKSETLEAQWSEFDMEAATWTIPASRAKTHRDHRVPLSKRAMLILARCVELSGGSRGFVFHGRSRAKAIDANTMNKMIAKVGVQASPHGFRSTFRDWCGETEKPRELAEAALAHSNPNATEAAYARSDLFDRRRGLMDQWAEYVSA